MKTTSIRRALVPGVAAVALALAGCSAANEQPAEGREEAAASKLREDARLVAEAGASLLVLECVPTPLAAAITAESTIPTIGIGAGPHCDGQVLVLHDLLGAQTGHRRPKFVKDFLAEGGSLAGAVRAFADAVREGRFPDADHSYA